MIFTELTLTNVGLYSGKQIFDLKPLNDGDNSRPIVLFGGKNGAGKTTILESITLCLYGREALGERVEKSNYERYLSQKIHHNPSKINQPTQARITLKFEHAHAGVLDVYKVERSWAKNVSEIQESLIVQKNDQYLSNIHDGIWQNFVKDLVPPGVSQLFFFDGEKIQEFAEDETSNTALAEAVKATFGLNLVEYLKKDVTTYRRREEFHQARQEWQVKLASLEKEKEEVEAKFQNIRINLENAQRTYDLINKQFIKIQEDLDREGWLFAQQKNEVENTISILEGELKQLEKRIREAEGLEPFTAIPELCLALRNQLLNEEKYNQWKVSKDSIREYSHILLEKLSFPHFWQDIPEIAPDLYPRLTKKVRTELQDLERMPADFEDFRIVHELSEKDRWQLLQSIDQILTIVPEKMQRDFAELEELYKKLEEVKLLQKLVPEEDILQPLVEKRNVLLQRAAEHKQVKDKFLQEAERLKQEKTSISIQIERIEEEIHKETGQQERIVLASRMERVIERFYQQLLDDRVQELESTLVRYFGQLSRKKDMVWKAKIDRDTFSVTLFTKDGQQLPKATLSAGEKQIYAIALLWALRDISGRPLPVVIDTPLGRLDSVHRQHIVENYFPFASHQVILLSTDTEIDNEYFALLEPSISHSYQLHYDQDAMCTTVSEGYFWKNTASLLQNNGAKTRELPVLNNGMNLVDRGAP